MHLISWHKKDATEFIVSHTILMPVLLKDNKASCHKHVIWQGIMECAVHRTESSM